MNNRAARCCACGVVKDNSEYARDRTRPSGHSCTCKACRAKYKKEYRKRTDVKKKINEYRRKYYASHKQPPKEKKEKVVVPPPAIDPRSPEAIKKINGEYKKILKYLRLKECRKCGCIKPESEFEAVRASLNHRRPDCRVCDRERKLKRSKRHTQSESYKKRRDQLRSSGKLAYMSLLGRNRRRAKKIGANDCFAPKDILFVKKQFGEACFNCGATGSLSIDHHWPLDMGAPLTVGNAVLLCASCNSSKGITRPDEFYSTLQLLLLDVAYGKDTQPPGPKVKIKPCADCGIAMEYESNGQRYCDKCRKRRNRERVRRDYEYKKAQRITRDERIA